MPTKDEVQTIINDLRSQYPIEEEISFNEFNINEKLANNTFLFDKYTVLYIQEQKELERILRLKIEYEGKLFHKLKFKNDEVLSKYEIEKYYLPRDNKLKALNKIIAKQEIRVKFFEMCLEAVKNSKWNMKTFSDNLRMLGG